MIYLGDSLRTSAAEVFGAHRAALVCPRYRVAAIIPAQSLIVQNLRGAGAMMIGGLPAMSVADVPRSETQAWARAIHEDCPGHPDVCGVRYESAYAGGVALALWDTAPPLEVAQAEGRRQDFALGERGMFERLLVALAPLRIEVRVLAAEDCPRCARS